MSPKLVYSLLSFALACLLGLVGLSFLEGDTLAGSGLGIVAIVAVTVVAICTLRDSRNTRR